ncbi:MAG: UvrD-helicase domain-containing protein, partial [Alphaproteobacteria bacterium]|nr:UvrD-helicase domain-containing protein [Alphaproteobacteria bacterium]
MNTQAQPNTPPALNPNEKQQIASNPAQSVWVDASAGTGKTKILTDRVLRLLLSGQDRPASPPERIVCITFTKAAASEMSLRITKELSKWSICADTELDGALTSLMGHTPNAKQVTEARTLFARVIDVPGGLKIMTIHAFCQSILQKFPLEAGLSPNFTVLTPTEAKEAIRGARLRVLGQAKKEPNSQLGKAVRHLSVRSGDSQLMTFLENGLQEKQQILNVFERIPNIEDLKPALLDNCKLPKNLSEASLIEDFIKNTPTQDIEAMIAGFPHGTSSDKKRVPELQAFLKTPSTQIDNYCNIFLTQKNTIRKAATQGTLKHAAEIELTFPTEAERCLDMIEERAKFYMVEDTHDFLCVSHTILDAYAKEKQNRNGLDFDDLISITHKLLKNSESAAQWVLFKLDQGIDHLLVDEAQDTNPEQWSVVEALSEEFFHGNSSRDSIERTIFVVGDEKQSIYSFQKADPEIFRKMQTLFKNKVKRASKQWEDVPLSLSFRSTDAVLTLVDTVFSQDDMRQSLTAQNTQVNHTAYRVGMAGHVELWPMIFGDEKEELEPWSIPRAPTTQSSAADLMAQKIAGTIKHWIDSNKILESEDRPINAGDIMILLKKRSVFQKTLVRALKTHNIPVGGLDRMILQEHIAVKDVLAALEFGLLPQDDLTLAILLKSPLINWSEDQLMNFILTHKGKNTLWSAIREHGNNIEQGLYDYLLNINSLTLKKRPFDVISFILNHPCPADRNGSGLRAFIKRLGQDSIDPLQELLNTALDIESEKGVSVQAFVHTLKRNEKDIKREMEDGAGAVRIMTVHGSKGLQSPIVFLPDTIRTTQSRDNALQAGSKLLWPRRSGLNYPFWAPR